METEGAEHEKMVGCAKDDGQKEQSERCGTAGEKKVKTLLQIASHIKK